MSDCEICKTPDEKKPMCFRGEKWCCDIHRKMVIGELPHDFKPAQMYEQK